MRVQDGEGAATEAWSVHSAHPLLLEPQTLTSAPRKLVAVVQVLMRVQEGGGGKTTAIARAWLVLSADPLLLEQQGLKPTLRSGAMSCSQTVLPSTIYTQPYLPYHQDALVITDTVHLCCSTSVADPTHCIHYAA